MAAAAEGFEDAAGIAAGAGVTAGVEAAIGGGAGAGTVCRQGCARCGADGVKGSVSTVPLDGEGGGGDGFSSDLAVCCRSGGASSVLRIRTTSSSRLSMRCRVRLWNARINTIRITRSNMMNISIYRLSRLMIQEAPPSYGDPGSSAPYRCKGNSAASGKDNRRN